MHKGRFGRPLDHHQSIFQYLLDKFGAFWEDLERTLQAKWRRGSTFFHVLFDLQKEETKSDFERENITLLFLELNHSLNNNLIKLAVVP